MSRMLFQKSSQEFAIEAAVFVIAIAMLTIHVAVDVPNVIDLFSPDGIVQSRTERQIQFVLAFAGIGGLIILTLQVAILFWLRRSSYWALKSGASLIQKQLRDSMPVILILTVGICIAINIKDRSIDEWNDARGAEYVDIATSIAAGHGFSYKEGDRWFWLDFSPETEHDAETYYATAIEEPIYPYILAASIGFFGNKGVFALVVLQFLSWVAACLLTYSLGRALFSPNVGLFSAIMLAWWPNAEHMVLGYLGPSPFALLIFTATAYLVTYKLKSDSSNWWIAATGVLLGLGTLTLASSQIFIPIASATLIINKGWTKPQSWGAGLLLALVAALVISPWTYRNWSTFGEFVPVRTGMGLISHQGNPTLAGSFMPGPHVCSDTLGPFWTAKSIPDAMHQATTEQAKEIAIYKRSFECIAQNAPSDYEEYNEPQRDAFYLQQAKKFIYEYPWTFAKMAYYKYLTAIKGQEAGRATTVFGFLCLIGMAICLVQRKAIVLVAMILAYFAPYALGIPWGYRYRFPIEPLVIIFGIYAVSAATDRLKNWWPFRQADTSI